MVKIGVIGDTHLAHFADLPNKMLEGLKDVDLILHTGDFVDLAVWEGLKKIGTKVKAVWGNMDSAEVKQILPEKEIIEIEQFRLGLTHGWGAPFNLRKVVKEKFGDERLDCIVYGHSHSAVNETDGGILYFNPGSPTDKFFAPYNSFGILTIEQKIVGKIIRL